MLPYWRKSESQPLSRFREEFDRLLGDFFEARPGQEGMYLPALDLRETDNELIVETELPGINPEEVKIEVHDDVLSIEGERRQEAKDGTTHRQECCYGRFERQIALPSTVDSDKAEATFANGMLTVKLPKKPEAKPKAIQIKPKTNK